MADSQAQMKEGEANLKELCVTGVDVPSCSPPEDYSSNCGQVETIENLRPPATF